MSDPCAAKEALNARPAGRTSANVYTDDLVWRTAQAFRSFVFPYMQDVIGNGHLAPEQLVKHHDVMSSKQPNIAVSEAFAAWYLAWSITELLIVCAKQTLRPEFGGWEQYLVDVELDQLGIPDDLVPS